MCNIFHLHKFKIIEVVYNPPVKRALELRGQGDEITRQILFGSSVIISECKECGKLDQNTIAGKFIL